MNTRDRGRRFGWIAFGSLLFLTGVDPAAALAQSQCAKLQYSAAGAAAHRKAACAAKAAAAGAPVDAACLAAADARLAQRWAKAIARGDCPTTAEAAGAQEAVDSFLASLNALLEPPAVSHCCATATTCFAGPSIDEASCTSELFGTPGEPGSVCDGATGACVPPPGAGGSCCSLTTLGICTAGPGVAPAACVAAGGLDFPGGVCLPSGACAIP
jgi:hypothetical protein